ncbi:MAG: response regulator [Sedimentisphaerales bacterium]|nr:response regulator [Sedimentisphaerales bacterium]
MAVSAMLEIGEVVTWLKSIESRVGSIYTKAAEHFVSDKDFSNFLIRLSEDEKLHSDFMSMVYDYLIKNKKPILLDVFLDEKTIDNVEGLLEKFERHLAGEKVAKKLVIEYMARAESCELNPVFLYIAGTFGSLNRETEYITSEIQSHLLRIQDYIDALSKEMKPYINIENFTTMWDSRFLIVDDNESLRKLVCSLLSSKGNAEMASDGQSAMELVRKHFYNAIVSDIEMPGMDGFEFYQKAIEYDPRLKQNFVFYSANITPQREEYLNKNHLPFLRKPFGLSDFQSIIEQFLRG